MTLRVANLSIDTPDPVSLAAFWSAALGGRPEVDADGDVVLEVGGPGEALVLLFLADDGAKSVKNRLHLDLEPDDQAAEVARLEALGAARVDVGQSGTESWVVMADPEGNEFCVLSDEED